MRIKHPIRTLALPIIVGFALMSGLSGAWGRAYIPALANVPQQSGVPSLTSPSTDQSVKLEVLALDQNYQPVTDMKPEDFRLTQNKQDVKINSAQFKASGMLNFALVFDLSGSRRDDRRFREEFAETSDFLRRMWQAGDMATVVAFNDLPHTVISATQNLDAAVRGLDSLAHVAPRGSTALYDVICSVAMDQNSASPSRKVVLIFSDFDDDSSRNTAQQGIECAWKGKMSIYPFIIINEHSEQKETSHDLKTASAFSEQSGGVAFNTKSASELSESLSQLTQFLHSSYEITFTPPPAKPGENPVPIDVETTRPGVKLYSARRYYDQ